jgi:uridine kinase
MNMTETNWLEYNKKYLEIRQNRVKPLLIGITGGSACGKTSVGDLLVKSLDIADWAIIPIDSYYKDLTEEEYKDLPNYNFDHPNSIDFDLIFEHLNSLLDKKEVNVPIYDFTENKRSGKYTTVKPCNLIIFEGILALYDKRIRSLMDVKIFVDTDADTRLARRSNLKNFK